MKRLLDNRGDAYFEFLICLVISVIFISLTLQVLSVVKLKLWVDSKTSSIVRNVQVNGEITPFAEDLLSEIRERIGDSFTVSWDTDFLGQGKKIQLGKEFRLRVSGEVPVLKIGRSGGVDVKISSEAVGTSEIYWKTP